VRGQLETLARHCADIGRPYEEIERTITTAMEPDESVDHFVERCRSLAEIGIEHVVVITRGRPWTDDAVATLGAAAARLEDV
jgi:hypothetical protein